MRGGGILPQATVSVPVVSMNTPINLVYVGFFETLDECRVDYYRPDGMYSVADYEVLDEMICDMIPGIQLVRNGSHRYNCHSYAWYSQSSANDRWIKYPTGYLNDIHCERISQNQIEVGDLVVYYSQAGEPLHTARVHSVESGNYLYISKWGTLGVFIHSPENVPSTYSDNGNGYCYFYKYPDEHHWDHQITSAAGHHCMCLVCERTTIEPHSFLVCGYDMSGHEVECTECGFSTVQTHVMNANGVCKVCRYSGPVQGGGLLNHSNGCDANSQ